MMNAADPALAEYSSASPGAPWLVSPPTLSTYSISPDFTSDSPTNMASLPALQANSKSAQWQSGVAPMASATMVPEGFTA
jgi:hypothetical protein